jgi:oxygen-independent coproporphyrinogen-3 oxidase
MVSHDPKSRLLERFERSRLHPPLMMLYPPVSTGRPYDGSRDPRALWAGAVSEGTLYVHIPFCASRCAFCPFHAAVGKPEDFERYVDAVLEEAALYAPGLGRVRFTSLYLGGGTPSVFPPVLIGRLLRELRRRFRLEGADVSLEAHPLHAERARLAELHAAGVTRLSLGIQSFDPRALDACGRGETAPIVRGAVERALAVPFGDVNVDLMYGLPDHTLESWRADLHTAVALGVPSLTLYATVYLPEFRQRCEVRGARIAGDAERLAMYDLAYDGLNAAGYRQPRFGAASFSKGGLSAHRRNVALGLPTLGLGTWAYSSSGDYSYHNHAPTPQWAAELGRGRPPIRQLLEVPDAERARKVAIEALLLGYVDLERFREAVGRDFGAVFPVEMEILTERGLGFVEDGELRLTREGGHHLREVRYLFASEDVVEALESGAAQGL